MLCTRYVYEIQLETALAVNKHINEPSVWKNEILSQRINDLRGTFY